MIKKLISLVCCVLPMGAGAVVVGPEVGQNSISTEQAAWTDAIAADSTITINSANVNGITSKDGFSIAGNMYVGASSDQGSINGDLYVLNTVQDPFTVVSTGDVSVGAILQVLDGKSLGFKTSDTDPSAFNLTVGAGQVNEGIYIGTDTQNAKLTLAGIKALTVKGAVIAYGDFSVNANSVDVGLVNVNSGNTNIVSAGAVALDGLVANAGAGKTNISAGTSVSSSGTIQNNADDITITSVSDVVVTGNLENAVASDMTVSGGDLVVSGTMKNDTNSGVLTLNLNGWHVNGGTDTSYSFVNNGDLYATVTGETYFEYGLNLGGMTADNVFSLDTGTLAFGENATTQTWFNAFSNNLNNFNLAVRDGNINVGTILNGMSAENVVNASADMSVLAQNVSVTTVRNQGDTLVIKAADLDSGYDVTAPAATTTVGNINVSGQIIAEAGTVTDIIAAGVLTAQGAVSNAGVMELNGNTVNLASVSNTGRVADLTISSLTEASGKVNISGNVTNTDGKTTIWAKDVSIGGVITNNSGTTNIYGSDTNGGAVQLGALVASGGVVELNALAGDVDVDGVVTVSGGSLNLGDSLRNLTVDGSVQVAGDVTASADAASGAGDVNVAASGTQPFVLSADAVVIDGNISAVADDVVRNLQIDSVLISVGKNATVENDGYMLLGKDATAYVDITGDLTFNDGGTFETYANDLVVGTLSGNSRLFAHGANITADAGNIDITGNVYFDADNDPVAPTSGLIVRTTDELTLKATATGADINVGAVSVGAGNTLSFDSVDIVKIGGVLANNGMVAIDAGGEFVVTGAVNNTGTVNVSANMVDVTDVDNSGDMEIVSTGSVDAGNITTSDSLVVNAGTDIVAGAIAHIGGVMDVTADLLQAQSLVVNGAVGTQANIDVAQVEIVGNVNVSGDFAQGGTSGMMNIDAADFAANNLTVGGDFVVTSGSTSYDIDTNVRVTGDIDVASGAVASLNAGNSIVAANLTNSGMLDMVADQGIDLDEVVNNAGILTLDSGDGALDFATLTLNAGNLVLRGMEMNMTGAIATGAMLYQNWGSTLADKDINIDTDVYEMTTAGLDVAGIRQDGKLTINTSDIDIGGDIVAYDLRFAADPSGNWMNVSVGGNVSGDVDFVGLEKMTIGGNYTFNDGSQINAAVLPYAVSGGGINETDINYWATVSLADDKTLGQITNAADASALITVGGKFESDLNTLGALTSGGKLGQPQIGINIFDIVDQGTAIWFLHAQDGVADLATKIRNLNVSFCNADGSVCYDYLTSLDANNGTDEDLPAYVSVRDVDDNGVADSLYIVFDSRFGGPVEVFKIQPIVAREEYHTNGEYVSAGALDDMIAGQLINKKFYNRTPIEVIPLIFDGTNLSEMANQLYNRMEDYVLNRDGAPLARFSRLFQVREIEQIAGSIALNEHTAFRSFEDRMFDEFIWNRNRDLKKAWLDVDYGMFYQNIDDNKHTDGNRFSISGGFDWQESNTLVLGLTGRVSHTSSKAADAMDLSYTGYSAMGDVKIDVADTNVGFGGYLMKILGEKTRLYGNAFMDLHILDVNRYQNYVDTIDGDGTAFSLMSEWGLMHDVLNQYVVGNAYARVGYNFGFSVKEKAAGDDYMRLKSDGYFVLTPGYSLIAQKRIYPSAWFQIRPYASVGVEYDVFGAPDFAKYKFAVADEFTKYDIDIDPLWANIGGGIELLSARGIQVGVDYRYQYNDDIQLHNIKVSGSYRF